MLTPDANVYCTRKKDNVNVLMKFSENRGFSAEQLSFSAPIGEGLVFVSHDPIDPASTSAFDSYDAVKWRNFLQAKRDKGEPLTPSDPACYFNLQEGWCLVQKLDVPRSGLYVLVKLLRARSPNADNIDIQYFGFKGYTGPTTYTYAELL